MERVVGLHPREAQRRHYWRVHARFYGFTAREADRLAFWKWLAQQRGETKQRGEGGYVARVQWTFGARQALTATTARSPVD